MELNDRPQLNRSDSTSSEAYLTDPCKKRPSNFNWRSCWAKFGNLSLISLILVNVFLVFILLPLISSCISRLDKIVENQNEYRNTFANKVEAIDSKVNAIDSKIEKLDEAQSQIEGKMK